jgi:hypothetical protein
VRVSVAAAQPPQQVLERRVAARPSRGQRQVPGAATAVLAAPRTATPVAPVPPDAQPVKALRD